MRSRLTNPAFLAGLYISTTSAALENAILALNPLGYWPLTEVSGSVASDLSGNGRHGTYSGTVTLNAETGPDGQPVPSFNGGRVTIPDDSVFSFGASYGLTWFGVWRPASVSVGARRFLITKGAASNYEWELTANNSVGGRLTLMVYSFGGATRRSAVVEGALTADWNVIAGSAPDYGTGSDLDLYVDGPLELSSTVSTSSSEAYQNGTAPIEIGNRADSGTNPFIGEIREVAVFAGKIDVSSLMNAAALDGWYTSGHSELTSAIAALSPTYSWDSSVSSGNLSAITGGTDLTATGTASYRKQIGTGDLLGIGFSGSQRFDATLGLTDDQPFTFFCAINANVNNPSGTNWTIAHTGNTGVSSFSSGLLALLSNFSGAPACIPYAMVAKTGVIRGEVIDAGIVMFNQSFTYAVVYDGSNVILYANGVAIDTQAYSGGVDHSDSFRLGTTRGNTSPSAAPFQGRIGYPAWWQNTALDASDISTLHAASGL